MTSVKKDKKEKKKAKLKGRSDVDATTAEQAANGESGTIPIGDGVTENGSDTTAEVELDEVEGLKAKVAELEIEKLRALADLDNYRKLMARRFQDVIVSTNERLLGGLLDIVDNFERALAHVETENGNGGEPESFRKGTELIYNQLVEFLAKNEVKVMETAGQVFDPNLHEALMQMPSDEYDEGAIVNEISKGYLLGERVLRHAKVAVSSGQATDAPADSSHEN